MRAKPVLKTMLTILKWSSIGVSEVQKVLMDPVTHFTQFGEAHSNRY